MNTCITLTCDICESDIDCRIGYSNRTIQPLNFACPHCESLLEIILDISDAPESKFEFNGCTPSVTQPETTFTGDNPFIDLHLDFPVREGSYSQGLTPFLVAMNELRNAVDGDSDKAYAMYLHHNTHLTALNDIAGKSNDIKRLINLYFGKNQQLFMQRAASFLEQKFDTKFKIQDVIASLYSVIASAFFPFTLFENNRDISTGLPKMLRRLEQDELTKFFDSLEEHDFLRTIHRDCLRVYPRVLDAELQLRTALFVELLKTETYKKNAVRVSTQDFSSLKDLYKDILEILSRQLLLVAGINNLSHRDDANSFNAIDGGKLRDLSKFSSKVLSDKFKYLDECWFKIDESAFNFKLRNAIAHNNVRYEAVRQCIVYIPEGGRLEQKPEQEISMLDFKCLLLRAFREMHDLNMVIKCFLFWKAFIYDKRK